MAVVCVVGPGPDQGLSIGPKNERNGNDQSHQVQIDFVALIECLHIYKVGPVDLHYLVPAISLAADRTI